ncbi:MAG: hypothetical protein JXA01_06175 [Dehalococcoidia bacterium]|nr:hypothetical protein [Dehalococcoidia bacterium]
MNSRRILLITFALMLIAFGVSGLLPAHTYAATTINVTPIKGVTGSQAALTGDGFIGKLATIYWDDKKLVQNVPISKTGQINFTFEIPSSTRGNHSVKVTDDSNWANINASAVFTVLPSIALEPQWGKSTATVTVFGYGFVSEETDIRITWEGKQLSSAPAKADRNGAWYSTFVVPYVAKGEYTIGAYGHATGATEVTDMVFTVSPFCKATPLSGPVGTKVMISGVGFRAGEDGITFTWDGPILDTNFVAQPNGSFSYPITVPPSTKGRHILGIYGSSFTPKGIVPDIEFEVTPSIKLTPSDLINSRDLTVEGCGFNANESIAISYDKSSTGVSANTDGLGNFTAVIQAPVSPSKEHQVTATGNKGALAQANYTSISIAPSAPQLLFPGPGAKIQTSNSIFDVMLSVFRYIGSIFDAFSNSSQKISDSSLTDMNWDVAGDASALKYTLQISKTQNFSNILFTQDNIQSNSYNLSKSNLPADGIYYWRVKASNDSGGTSPWSNIWSFHIITTSPLILAIAITIIILLIAIIIFGIIALISRRRYAGY